MQKQTQLHHILEGTCRLIGTEISGVLKTTIRNVKKLDLMVVRVTKMGDIGNARPCHNCLKMMKDIGIKKVFYSTGEDENIVCEHVRNMVSIQSSSVTRFLNSKSRDYDTYYKNLLLELFPPQIKNENLLYFINYNLKLIFPNYQVNIKTGYVFILDDSNMILIKSQLI
jgi:hypothetical protein